jgi:hypothetical protein
MLLLFSNNLIELVVKLLLFNKEFDSLRELLYKKVILIFGFLTKELFFCKI